MPTETTKLKIKKPLGNETVTRAGFNENWDQIDKMAVMEPFLLETPVYEAANDRIVCAIGPGKAELFNGDTRTMVTNDVSSTYHISAPVINTTYYLYLQADGTLTHNTTGAVPAGAVLIWQVATGATVSTLTCTDRRAQLSGAGAKLAAHLADNVKHTTQGEKDAWNAKETPAGAQAKVDALGASLTSGINSLWTNIGIVLRNILKLLLKQTGINAGVNAWSDTLENTSGINAGQSANYYFDSVNKSLKSGSISYPTNYSFDNLTGGIPNGWTLSQSADTAGNSFGANAGWYTAGAQSYYLFSSWSASWPGPYHVQISQNIDFTGVKNLLIDVITSSLHGNGGGIFEIFIGGNRIWYTTSPNQTYNLNLDVSAYTGVQTLTLKSSVPAAYVEKQALVHVDNVRLFSIGAGSATVVWNPQSSEGTLAKAVIEAVQNLGTGTITYYISRDSGVTYTQCTKGVITDISAQPAGTNIVCKAVITGNAELLAIAFGGEV